MNFLTRFLNNLNTHTIGGIGIGTALVGVAALASQHGIDATIAAHVPGSTGIILQGVIDQQINNLAQPVIAIGAALAYAGRPGNVPAGPVQTQSLPGGAGIGPQVK